MMLFRIMNILNNSLMIMKMMKNRINRPVDSITSPGVTRVANTNERIVIGIEIIPNDIMNSFVTNLITTILSNASVVVKIKLNNTMLNQSCSANPR